MKKPKFTIVDYIIIIVVIAAIAFAFIHVSTDKEYDVKSTSFDISTITKVMPTYLGYYRDGLVTTSTVTGHNATNGEKVEIKGKLVWIGEDLFNKPVAQIETGGIKYLVGLYEESPYCDIYLDKITVETNGEKYNVTEITASPKNISNVGELAINTSSYYEVTTLVTSSSIDSVKYQTLFNELVKLKRIALRVSETGSNDQLFINRASNEELTLGSNILGNINGVTGQITIKVYNCTDSDIQLIKEKFDVKNIRTC